MEKYLVKRWSEILSIISGINQKAVVNPAGKYPIYGSGGKIGVADDFLCEAGTTIVGRKGTINNPIFVNERFWNVDTAFGICPGPELNPNFLYYFCCFFDFRALDKSTTIPSLAKSDLLNIEMPVPSLSEQERIVSRIEELFSQLDSGVETLKKVKQQLAVYRQAVLKEAFEGTLTGVKPYTVKRLGEYIEPPRYGTSKKCSYNAAEGHIQVYRIPNIDHAAGQIEHSDIKYAAFTEQELEGIKLKEGDILIIRSNGSISLVGRAAMVYDVDTNGTFAGYLMRLRIRDIEKMKPKYLLWFLHSHSARIYIEGKAKSTSGVHNINSKEISELPIPLFSPTEQVQIVQTTETRLSICGSIEQTVDTALQQAEAMRKSILKQAFGGG